MIVVLAILLHTIRSSRTPIVRAIEAVGILLPTVLIVFAAVYLQLSGASSDAFSEPLDRIDAIYFAASVLATVGFGDISAVSPAARLFVTAQMIVDLVLLAGFARLLVAAIGEARGRAR